MEKSRREFVKQSLLGAIFLNAGGASLLTSCSDSRINELGLITGVIEKELEQDWEKTLRKVAGIGYRYLEFGNFFGNDKERFLKVMNETGIKPLAGGTSLAGMKKEEDLMQMIDDALSLGKKYMVCYWPWMDGGDNKTLDDFKTASEEMNRLGEICNKAGIRFLMHNHNKEFVPVQGYRWGYEVMLENTDPKLVGMELDLYWITFGGGDPFYLFDKYPGRYEIFHVKDMDRTPEKLYTCPGNGVIDFAKIFARSKDAGVKYYVVEIDNNPDPIQCIQNSYQYLMNLKF
jgi:sugar phosphate isomerase/epimerase